MKNVVTKVKAVASSPGRGGRGGGGGGAAVVSSCSAADSEAPSGVSSPATCTGKERKQKNIIINMFGLRSTHT